MSQDLKNNCSSNSSNEQPTPKKFSLENLGVTTENGKNSTLSDLVFVKVIDN